MTSLNKTLWMAVGGPPSSLSIMVLNSLRLGPFTWDLMVQKFSKETYMIYIVSILRPNDLRLMAREGHKNLILAPNIYPIFRFCP